MWRSYSPSSFLINVLFISSSSSRSSLSTHHSTFPSSFYLANGALIAIIVHLHFIPFSSSSQGEWTLSSIKRLICHFSHLWFPWSSSTPRRQPCPIVYLNLDCSTVQPDQCIIATRQKVRSYVNQMDIKNKEMLASFYAREKKTLIAYFLKKTFSYSLLATSRNSLKQQLPSKILIAVYFNLRTSRRFSSFWLVIVISWLVCLDIICNGSFASSGIDPRGFWEYCYW